MIGPLLCSEPARTWTYDRCPIECNKVKMSETLLKAIPMLYIRLYCT